MVNPVQRPLEPFPLGGNWPNLAPEQGLPGRWPRSLKYVNEPNSFLAFGTYVLARLGLPRGRFKWCKSWDSRVVVVPASREPGKSIDRTVGERKRADLQIAESNRREGIR